MERLTKLENRMSKQEESSNFKNGGVGWTSDAIKDHHDKVKQIVIRKIPLDKDRDWVKEWEGFGNDTRKKKEFVIDTLMQHTMDFDAETGNPVEEPNVLSKIINPLKEGMGPAAIESAWMSHEGLAPEQRKKSRPVLIVTFHSERPVKQLLEISKAHKKDRRYEKDGNLYGHLPLIRRKTKIERDDDARYQKCRLIFIYMMNA